jgi:NAD(P)-dependent dehydrogenase (short-subunit alcohol dehydrogenase family)
MMRRYDGRQVLVTGAGSGIGQGVALRLLAEGAQLVAADVDETGLKDTVEAAAPEDRARLKTVHVDVADQDSVHSAYAESFEFLGGLDVLVNAAGIMRSAHTHEMPLEAWNQVIGINLTGTFLMTRGGLPKLVESEHGGVIVNFSSTAAFSASPYSAAYAASKGGINAFTHSIALEYAKQGLRAVNIVPGSIASGITAKFTGGVPQDADWTLFARLVGWLNGGALGNPEDIAGVVAMVGSDDGRYITGSEIRVDGGSLM